MNNFNQNKKGAKPSFSVVVLIVVIIAVVISVGLSNVKMQGDVLKITGFYSMEVNVKDIKEVTLKDNIPKSFRRANGIDLFGMKYIGNFNSDEYGKMKSIIQSVKKPYLYVGVDNNKFDYIIISLSGDKTQQLYDRLKASQ